MQMHILQQAISPVSHGFRMTVVGGVGVMIEAVGDRNKGVLELIMCHCRLRTIYDFFVSTSIHLDMFSISIIYSASRVDFFVWLLSRHSLFAV